MKLKAVTTCFLLLVMSAFTLTSASAQQWGKNKRNTVTLLKNKKHNVGIGTGVPKEKLTVVGGVRYDGVRNVNGRESRNTVTLKRYHVEATKRVEGTTVPLDAALFNELCRDRDGCLLTLGMRNWADDKRGLTATIDPVRFYPGVGSNLYRQLVDSVDQNDPNAGVREDGDGFVFNVLSAWDCYLTDGEYVGGAATDNQVGFGLLNFPGTTFDNPRMVCVLIIED